MIIILLLILLLLLIITSYYYQVFVETILTSFVDGFEDNINNSIDILIFNPPYVPTPSEEICGNGIEVSWAGGINGREVIDKFIPKINV